MAHLLWLKTGPLHPADTGGRIRTLHMLRELRCRHEITYLSLFPEDCPESSRAFSDYATRAFWVDFKEKASSGPGMLAALAWSIATTRLPYVVWKYQSTAMAAEMARLHRETPFDLVVCDFLFPCLNFFNAPFGQRPPAVLFQHNVEAKIWERRSAAAGKLTKWLIHRQWQRLERFEAEACRKFDGVIAVSPEDALLMQEGYRLTNVLGDVPTGVDTTYFEPLAAQAGTGNFIAFLGSMNWNANIDGVLAFTREVWPEISRAFPDLKFRIIGRTPPPVIMDLEKQFAGVEVTGTVADVRPHLRGAVASIVPLRIGGGTRLKIYECMAAGIPVVSTRTGAEGLPLMDGRDLLIAEDIPTMKAPLMKLLSDRSLAARIGEQAFRLVREQYSWKFAADAFDAMIRKVIET